MWLLIDAGNTFIKWALTADDSRLLENGLTQWIAYGMNPHHELDVLSDVWRQVLSRQAVLRVMVSNVAGTAVQEKLQQQIEQIQDQPVLIEWFSSVPQLAGIKNSYLEANQLGCDRFAAMIGARALYPDHALLVVNGGTATTIDMVTEEGVFAGGMILPGLRLMAASLAGNTAQLPETDYQGDRLPSFATDTLNAIRCGCMAAQLGTIERTFSLQKKNHDNMQCILSGGAARYIVPYLAVPYVMIDNLVLIGLKTVVTHKN